MCYHHLTIASCFSCIFLLSQYVKELPDSALPIPERMTKAIGVVIMDTIHLIRWMIITNNKIEKNFYSGGYRSRTDDPLRARQML